MPFIPALDTMIVAKVNGKITAKFLGPLTHAKRMLGDMYGREMFDDADLTARYLYPRSGRCSRHGTH